MSRRQSDWWIVLCWVCWAIAAGGLLLALSGCAVKPQVIERRVEVPVHVTRVVERPVLPPAELLAPIPVPADLWLSPGDADASSCVAPPGEDKLLRFIGEHQARQAALRAWRDSAARQVP